MFYRELDTVWEELTAPGATFELERIHIGGESVLAFKNAPPTVRDLWLASRQFGDRDYIIYDGERLSYADAHARVDAIANWLLKTGLTSEQRVAIAMRNYPEWLLTYWACLSVGISVVGVNAWWTGEEMRYALADSAPALIVCDRERFERLLPHVSALPATRFALVRTNDVPEGVIAWDDILSTPGEMPPAKIDSDDDACIFYTSGTAGVPKGAILTHRNCITNIYNIMFAGQAQSLAAQRGAGTAPPAAKRPITLIPTPFFHVTGSNCLAYSVTIRGGAMVLLRKWDPGEALRLIEVERISEVSGVPVMAREILNHPELARFDTSSLISIAGGGASFQEDLIGRVVASVPTARPRTGYGMTETTGSITTISADFLLDKPSSVGRILPTFEYRFVDDDGVDVQAGEAGELWVRGAAVIKGYLNQPEATAATITQGWLHTGDLAQIDAEKFLHIVGRKKDMVIRGGENVYCAEVENCIQQHPDVAECCVFGIPDERLGEAVAAAVVLKPGARGGASAIAGYCESRIARHKIPSRFWFLDTPIPRNATGKFMKREVKATLLAELGEAAANTEKSL